jgi:DNA repair ATPase RecN
MIVANDERPRIMHAEAEHTGRELLPERVAQLLDRHDSRRAARREAWRQYTAAERAWQAAYERMTAAADRSSERSRSRDQSYGFEV